MTQRRGERSRFAPNVPGSIAAVNPSIHGLAHAGPAVGSYLAEGRRARFEGDQRELAGTAIFPTIGSFSVHAARLGRAANIVLSPGLVRRDLVGNAGLVVETLLVAPDLPLVVVQWTGEVAIAGPITIDFGLAQGAGASVSREDPVVERSPDGCALRRGSAGLAVGVSPRPMSIDVSALDGGDDDDGSATTRATLHASASATTTLILAGGDRKAVAKAFGAAAHLDGHALRAAAGPSGGLVLDTGIGEIDDGVAWARARLGGLVDRLSSGGGHGSKPRDIEALLLGLAALAVGDRELSARAATAAPLLAESERSAAPAAALLAARRAGVIGDVASAATIARTWVTHGATPAALEDPALFELARQSLADGLLHAVPDTVLSALRGPAGRLLRPDTREARVRSSGGGPRAGAGPGRGRPLPMAGSPREETSWGAWLSGLLAGRPSLPAPSSNVESVASVRRATGLFVPAPNVAWADWRRILGEGLRAGPLGPATWDEDGQTALAAELLLALVHGMLGISHDAPAGRLGIAPRMPDHLTAFHVKGITVGGSSVELGYERSGSTHVLRLQPEIATVPPVIVLEPMVAGQVATVRIDGRPADLDVRFDGERSVVPVQLPLEGPRVVEIVTA